MEMLVQSSRGELITITIQVTDTFSSLKEQMSSDYSIQMDFTNFCKGKDIDLNDNILDYLKRNNQKLTMDIDYRLRSQFALNQLSIDGPSTTAIFGTVMLEPETARAEEIYVDEDELMVPSTSCSQDPIETTSNDRTSEQTEQSRICRLCSMENHELIPIFGSTANHGDIAGKIRDSFLIIVKETDASKQICKSCIESLEKYHEFCEKVLKLNEKLGYSKYTRNYHERKKPLERLCHSCCGRFADEKELWSHYDGIGNDAKWQCNMCTAKPSFRTKCRLGLHQKNHTSVTRGCVSCGSRFANVPAYINHMKGNENDEKLHCPVCNASFRTKCSLGEHELTHNQKWEGECLSCGAKFFSPIDLLVHLQGLEDDPELKCPTCDASFRTNCALVTHKLIHPETCSGQNIFSCAECGENFKEETDLTTHVNLHALEKPLTCEICGKTFKKQLDIDTHLKVHGGERPYKCKICNKGFVNSARLREHKIQSHTDEKHYKCSLCDKAFKRPYARKAHMAIHTGTKAVKCDMCGGSFNRGSEMRDHKILMHNL